MQRVHSAMLLDSGSVQAITAAEKLPRDLIGVKTNSPDLSLAEAGEFDAHAQSIERIPPLASREVAASKWAMRDSNPRLPACKATLDLPGQLT